MPTYLMMSSFNIVFLDDRSTNSLQMMLHQSETNNIIVQYTTFCFLIMGRGLIRYIFNILSSGKCHKSKLVSIKWPCHFPLYQNFWQNNDVGMQNKENLSKFSSKVTGFLVVNVWITNISHHDYQEKNRVFYFHQKYSKYM